MAGPFDFTGQNIEDSYQRVLQTDGTSIYDGTGSLFSLPSAFPYTGSARITGSLGVTGSVSVSGSIIIATGSTNAMLFVKNPFDATGGTTTAIFEHRWGTNALSQTQRYGIIVRAAPGEGTTALGISNQAYNSMLQGYDYVSGVYKGISLSPLGGSVSIGRNLLGTADDIAKFVVRGSGTTSATTTMRVENTNASASLVVLDNGYVGVGTANPTYKLTVQGTTLADSSVSSQGSFNLNPLTAPVAIGGYTLSAGSALGVGTYYYFVVYVTSLGETSAGSTLTVTTTTGNTTVNLTDIPISTDSRVLARKIYRTKVNFTSDNEWFLATINDNITTTYTDTTPDASLTGVGLQAYKVNTTSRYITTNGTQGMILDANLTALGLSAGRVIISSNAAAVRSVFIGALAGENVTTGTANVLIGGASGRNLTTGGSNTLIGDLAGFVISNASNNTAIGSQTARYLTTGGNNIIIGASSANVLTDGSTQFTQGTNNTILGNSIRMSTITDTNSIVIGNTAWGLGSNTAVLGNDSTTRTALRGNISIGTTGSISSALHVKGSGTTNATTAFRVENSNTSASLVVLDNGNIGIGGEAMASSYKLRVYGTIWADGFAQLSTLNGYAGVGVIGFYDGGTTFRMRVYGTHPSEAVKGILSIDRQDLTYSGLENTITHTASFYQDHPSLVIRSNNTAANSFYLQNYMYASGALFVTSQPAGGDTSFRFKPSASITSSPDVFVINTSGVQVTGSLGVTGASNFSNGLTISSSTTINDAFAINIPEAGGPIDDTRPAGFYKVTINGVEAFLPYYL